MPNGMPLCDRTEGVAEEADPCAGSSSVAATSSVRPRTVRVARPAARRLRTHWTSPHGDQIQRLPEASMIAIGVVRGRPLFRPRTVTSPFEAEWNAGGQQDPGDRVEDGDPTWSAPGTADSFAHSVWLLHASVLPCCHRGDPHEGADVTAADGRDPQPATTVRSSCASRTGSARMSIATILPPLTVRARTANGLPSGDHATPPGIPLTRIACGRFGESTEGHRLLGDGLGAVDHRHQARARGPAVGPDDDVRVEDGEESPRSPRHVRRQGTRRRRPTGRRDRRPARAHPGPGDGPGSRAASSRWAFGRRSARSRRTAPRRRRGARRRRARRASASPGRRASRARSNRPAGLPARDPGPPGDSGSGPERGSRGTIRGASCAIAACSGRPDRRPSSARPAGCRRRSCRCGSGGSRLPGRRRPPPSGSRASGRRRRAGGSGSPRSARRASPGHAWG